MPALPDVFRRLLTLIRPGAAGLLGLWAAVACGQEAPEPGGSIGTGLKLSGFATVGLARSGAPSPWALRRDALIQPDHPGAHVQAGVDSRLGLQANYVLSPRWDAVAQVVIQPQASSAPWSQRLEWGYVGWRPNSTFKFHVGRLSADTFLLDDYRNVGFAYPWVRPSIEFYSGIPNHLDGVDGSMRVADDSGEWRIRLLTGRDDYVCPSDHGDVGLHLRHTTSLMVLRESAGLTLRGSFSITRFRDSEAPFKLFAGGGVWEHGSWSTSAEYSDARVSERGLVRRTGYVSVGRRVGDFTPFVMGSRAVSRLRNSAALPGGGGAPPPNPPILGVPIVLAGIFDESAGSLGMRWDWNSRADLKFQWDRVRVRADGGALWNVFANPEARVIDVISVAVDTVF